MTQATYALIRERVRAQILSGALGPGARLPTEAELQAQYKVSRVTAQQALRDLAREGLITRHRGRGSYVADGLREQNLLRMINFLSAGPELPGDHEVLSARVVPAGDLDLRRVGADAVEPVFDLRRRKRTDGDWVALERTHVPFRLAPHLLDEPLESWTTYDYLRRRGVALRRARMYVRPRQLDAAEAALLDTEAGAVNASRTRRMAPGLRSRDSRCAPTRSTSSSSTTSLEVGPKPAEIRALPNELKSGNAAHPGRVVAEAAGQV